MIPGMGADERLFRPQKAGGLGFESLRFPVPAPKDDLPTYAKRLADQLKLDSSCILAGVSFGGMVVCELARICPPKAALLIASCNCREAMPSYYTGLELMSRIVPDALVRRRAAASSRMLSAMESLDAEQTALIRDMSMDVEVHFLRRVGRMIVRWRSGKSLPCPTYHIHGARDRIIPIRHLKPDEVIPDGGHLINLTHADRVNAFIRRHAVS